MAGIVFQIALRGKGKILFPQYSGGIFLLGGGNLMRSDFDCSSENCYLVVGGDLVGGGRGMSKFLVSGGTPRIPPSRENPAFIQRNKATKKGSGVGVWR